MLTIAMYNSNLEAFFVVSALPARVALHFKLNLVVLFLFQGRSKKQMRQMLWYTTMRVGACWFECCVCDITPT